MPEGKALQDARILVYGTLWSLVVWFTQSFGNGYIISRLDKKWLTPFSDQVVEDWAKKGAKKLLVFSPAFVADCLETIIEIGTEYQEIFEEFGGKHVHLVPSNNDHPKFINGLEQLINNEL